MIAIPILYMIIVETPAKYILRYVTASGITSSGVFITVRSHGAIRSPTTVASIEAIIPKRKFV